MQYVYIAYISVHNPVNKPVYICLISTAYTPRPLYTFNSSVIIIGGRNCGRMVMKNALVPYNPSICAKLQIWFILSPITRRRYKEVYPEHEPTPDELAVFYGSYPDRYQCLAAWFRKICK